MSGGPFRELFVEVPLAILEAAVREAEARRPDASPSVARMFITHPDVWIVLFKEVQHNHSWKLIGWEHEGFGRGITVRVRLKCGHNGWFSIDEMTLHARAGSTRDLADYLLKESDKEPQRRCTCGTPQGLGPAGRPL